jgi:hypothetical protein
MRNYIDKAVYDIIPEFETISIFNDTYIDIDITPIYKLNTEKKCCELEIIIVCAVDNYEKLVNPENANKIKRLESYYTIEDTNTKACWITEQLSDYIDLIMKHNELLNK